MASEVFLDDIRSMKVAELRLACAARGLSFEGLKSELKTRLEVAVSREREVVAAKSPVRSPVLAAMRAVTFGRAQPSGSPSSGLDVASIRPRSARKDIKALSVVDLEAISRDVSALRLGPVVGVTAADRLTTARRLADVASAAAVAA